MRPSPNYGTLRLPNDDDDDVDDDDDFISTFSFCFHSFILVSLFEVIVFSLLCHIAVMDNPHSCYT